MINEFTHIHISTYIHLDRHVMYIVKDKLFYHWFEGPTNIWSVKGLNKCNERYVKVEYLNLYIKDISQIVLK